MNPFKLKPHPFSTIFPSASGVDYDNLLASVKKLKKLRYPIVIYQDQILDGNQRVRACRDARVEPKYAEFTGNDEEALDMVWDLNAGRRHLTPSQKASAVAKYTLMYEQGERTDLGTGAQVTTQALAEKVGVSVSSVKNAKTVLREGTDEEKEALETGKAKAKPLAEKIKGRREAADRSLNNNGNVTDDSGVVVPNGSATDYWNRRPEAKDILKKISDARCSVEKLVKDDLMWREVNLNGVMSDLNGAYNRFAAAVPAHVCPYCKGHNPDKCKTCRGRGVISKYMWSMVPEEMKKPGEKPF